MRKFITIIFIALAILNMEVFAYTDVTDTNLEVKLNDLSKYNIISGYEDNTFRPNDFITRAEFSKIVTCATMNDYISDYEQDFTDVSDGFWAEKYIYSAKTLGVVNGVTKNTFKPEANITNEQAIKMIVCALGYSEEAVSAGGYPNGYIKVALDLGIVSSNNFNAKDTATRAQIAEMIYNALDAKIYFLYVDENGLVQRSEAENTLREIYELSIDNSIVNADEEKPVYNYDEPDSVG